MGRIGNTIELARQSWRVLQADRELLLLPVLSALATLVVAATFLSPLFASGAVDTATGSLSGVSYVVLFAMYLVLAFVTVFFNAALVSAAHERLSGGDPTVGSAIGGAARHLGSIVAWSAVSATVSVVLRSLQERAGFLGQIVGGLAGIAWSLVTFLVIPMLVIEGVGVGEAVKRSASLFKRTWGEQVSAHVGFGLLGFVAALPTMAIFALAVGSGNGGLIALAMVLGVVWMIGVAVVLSALNGIFQAALYHYAVDGQVPGGFFDERLLQRSFTRR